MDSLVDFSPVDTSKLPHMFLPASVLPRIAGFIGINSIRLKKYGLQQQEEGNSF